MLNTEIFEDDRDFFEKGETWYTEIATELFIDEAEEATYFPTDSEVVILDINRVLKSDHIEFTINGKVCDLSMEELFDLVCHY